MPETIDQEKKAHLKSMITNIVHDRKEEAAVDFHNYLQYKMKSLISPEKGSQSSTDGNEE